MENQNLLYIHFDLVEWKHFIPISQSIITEQSVERIIKNLSQNIFKWNINVDIFVEAEDEGWLVKIILITVSLLASYALTEVANWILKWLTWKNISEHSENITIALKESVENFLHKPSRDLVEAGLELEDFYDAYEAKNNFYTSAIANKDILGIGFDIDHTFPIKNIDFPYKKIELKNQKIDSSSVDKFHDLFVISSINQESEKNLTWYVKDKISDEKFALYIDDEEFYRIYFEKWLLITEFKVRVRYTISIDNNWNKKIEKKRIVMVYEYNWNTKLMPLPKDIKFEIAPYKLLDIIELNENQTNLNV